MKQDEDEDDDDDNDNDNSDDDDDDNNNNNSSDNHNNNDIERCSLKLCSPLKMLQADTSTHSCGNEITQTIHITAQILIQNSHLVRRHN